MTGDWSPWYMRQVAELMKVDPRIEEAVTWATFDLATGRITDEQWESYLQHLAEPVILCPWCWDWEEIGDAVIRDGRMWCCSGCEVIAERRGEDEAAQT